jgi:hypothetical protein
MDKISSAIEVAREFDYASLPPDVADAARTAAHIIRNQLRTNIIEVGKHLLAIKARMDHGTFGAWVTAEFGITSRSSQRYMCAAELAAAKPDIVSLFPAASLHVLAARSAPEDVVNEILAAAEAGTVLSTQQIKAKMTDAIDAEREAKENSSKNVEQIEKNQDAERRRSAVAEARTPKHEDESRALEESRIGKAAAVAAFLVDRLTAIGVHELLDRLRGTEWHLVQQHLASAKLDAPVIANKSAAERAPHMAHLQLPLFETDPPPPEAAPR